MTRDLPEIPPQGCTLYPTAQPPLAYALILHDCEAQHRFIALLAHSLGLLGIGAMVVALRDMQQPLGQQSLTDMYTWQRKHAYQPQIAIGVGLGAELLKLLTWPRALALVCIDAPGAGALSGTPKRDLFSGPHISVQGGINLDSLIAQRIAQKTLPNKPCLWVGDDACLAGLELPHLASRLSLTRPLVEHSTDALLYARLVSSWIAAQLPNQAKEQANDQNLTSSVRMGTTDSFEVRIGNWLASYPANQHASEQLLLAAFAHASLVEIRHIALRNKWPQLQASVGIRSAESISQDEARYIREVQVLNKFDDLRKNTLHQELSDQLQLPGCTIRLINRVR